jgi:hypothetical protein
MLFNLALARLQRVLSHARQCEGLFARQIADKTMDGRASDGRAKPIAAKRKALAGHSARAKEPGLLFQRLL